MHFFTEYIEPLTLWLYAHPYWALLFTFIISFGESLAIIGSIIPGSITMTAIGIMAGSGVMRIDLTYLMAIIGAVAGDTGSYALGYTYSDKLLNIWPFKNHPNVISYGQNYFNKYGASSVLIGRFVGPMRSIIPMIAGMMHMKHWQFFIANVLSAIGWAILYVTPGILIGTASSELSTESSSRLFIFILILLVIVWLTGLLVKWLIIHITQFLREHLHNAWSWLQQSPRYSFVIKKLSPHDEILHHSTAALVVSFILCCLVSIIMTTLFWQNSWINNINHDVNLFFLSLRTLSFDTFFVIINLSIGPLSLITFMVSFALYLLYQQDWRTLRYWFTLSLTTGLSLYLLIRCITIYPINWTSKLLPPATYPDISLTLSTALFGFFIFYICTYYRTTRVLVFRAFLLIQLFLAGIAVVYLGDDWITTVISSYFIGLTVCLAHWILYRRKDKPPVVHQPPVMSLFLLLIISAGISCSLYFNQLIRSHNYQLAQYVMTDQVWWNQQQPILPIYSTNRIGKHTGLLNIQYVGSIEKLQESLQTTGWKRQPNTFLYTLIKRAGGDQTANELPLMAQLYQNRKPALIMSFQSKKPKVFIILRLWRSNYHLRHYRQPIWLGSVTRVLDSKQMSPSLGLQQFQQSISTENFMIKAVNGYKFNQIILPNRYNRPFPSLTSPILLMIKDTSSVIPNPNFEK